MRRTVPGVGDRNGSELTAAQAALRVLLELGALIGWGVVGWRVTDAGVRWLLVAALPIAAAILWGLFRAPDDHSAGGESPVPVPGLVRLLIELGILLGAAVLVAVVWRPWIGVVLGAAVVFHYVATLGRVRWLLDQRSAS